MGEHRGLSFDEYLAVDAMSSSGMREFARTPWHYRNRVPVVPTRPMLNGTLIHCAHLEPDAMASRYIITPEDAPRRPTAAQWGAKNPSPPSLEAMYWWTAFHARCEGRLIVPAADYSITQAQLAAIQAEPYLAELFSHGYSETSVFWVDKSSGVYCKARPDWIQPVGKDMARMVELKSTADESPEGFGRAVTRLGYHRARALYIDGFQQATGLKVVEYVFACITSAAPVLAVPYWMDEDDARQGEDEVAEHLARFAWCMKENKWPTYGDGPQIVGLQKWAKRSNELEVSYADA